MTRYIRDINQNNENTTQKLSKEFIYFSLIFESTDRNEILFLINISIQNVHN